MKNFRSFFKKKGGEGSSALGSTQDEEGNGSNVTRSEEEEKANILDGNNGVDAAVYDQIKNGEPDDDEYSYPDDEDEEEEEEEEDEEVTKRRGRPIARYRPLSSSSGEDDEEGQNDDDEEEETDESSSDQGRARFGNNANSNNVAQGRTSWHASRMNRNARDGDVSESEENNDSDSSDGGGYSWETRAKKEKVQNSGAPAWANIRLNNTDSKWRADAAAVAAAAANNTETVASVQQQQQQQQQVHQQEEDDEEEALEEEEDDVDDDSDGEGGYSWEKKKQQNNPRRVRSTPRSKARPMLTHHVAPPDMEEEVERGHGEGCYLMYDPTSGGVIFAQWTQFGRTEEEAIAYFSPNARVPKFKYKQNRGRQDILRGIGVDKKKFFEGITQFFKMARDMNGTIIVFPDEESLADVWYLDYKQQVHRVQAGERFDTNDMDVVAAIPRGNMSFKGVAQVPRGFFSSTGLKVGNALIMPH